MKDEYRVTSALRKALLQTEEHRRLYLSNAWFHAAVDNFMDQVIPTMLAGLVVQAHAHNEAYERMLNAVLYQKLVPFAKVPPSDSEKS